MDVSKAIGMEGIRVKLSTLWVFVMFNMMFADVIGFMNPGALKDIMTGAVGFEITQELLLVFSIFIPGDPDCHDFPVPSIAV